MNITHSEKNYFSLIYEGNPPWDIGHAQAAFVHLGKQMAKDLKVLDVGCGTGENALMFAELGFDITGIDYVTEAINKAINKANNRKSKAKFYILNALNLENLNQKFDVIIDSGLFHTLSNSERLYFKKSLSKVISLNGIYYMLCFSDLELNRFGPRRISKEEIYHTFNQNWNVISIEPEIFESNFGDAKAWLATIQYLG